jgi:hypothetical protein
MSEFHDKLEELADSLKTERDELHVRLHLFKAEARDEWEEIEGKWRHLEPKLKQFRESAVESGGEVGAAASQLAEEIGQSYRRMRDALR